MGVCTSTMTVGQSSTAKLILADGTLREFDRPVRAGSVTVEKSFDPNRYFLCDADEMEFDRLITAVGSDEWLIPGQIYFVLPKSMLRSPLQAEELAKLAVKASAALMKNSAPGGKSSVTPLMFEPKVVVPTAEKRRSGSGRGRGRKFEPDMCAIPE